MYIQVNNGQVVTVGGAEAGLPLDAAFLASHPEIRVLWADDYERLPAIGDRYDPETDTFCSWAQWQELHPAPVRPMSTEEAQKLILAEQMGLSLDQEKKVEVMQALCGALPLSESEDGVWRPGEWVVAGAVKIFGDDGKLYECLQAHITQADWTPAAAPALWAAARQAGGAWIQPDGAHNTYAAGDVVTHKGKVWSSTADDNVWEPGVYGWEEVE
jgi:hypothetical protein